jgi:hypothetical protein
MAQQHARPLASAACRELCPDRVEQRIMCAYVQLAAALDPADGSRTITLFRFGSLEIRLTEISPDMMGLPPLWLELRSPASGAIIDSLGCYEFDEDELTAAVEFILEAMQRVRILH